MSALPSSFAETLVQEPRNKQPLIKQLQGQKHSASPTPSTDLVTTMLRRVAYWRDLLRLAHEISIERRQLRGLGSRNLRDLGIDGIEADLECARGYFDLPRVRVERLRAANQLVWR